MYSGKDTRIQVKRSLNCFKVLSATGLPMGIYFISLVKSFYKIYFPNIFVAVSKFHTDSLIHRKAGEEVHTMDAVSRFRYFISGKIQVRIA